LAGGSARPTEVPLKTVKDRLAGGGFGPTNPAAVNGQLLAAAAPLVQLPVIQFAGMNAAVASGAFQRRACINST
jgi:hypothetical protein